MMKEWSDRNHQRWRGTIVHKSGADDWAKTGRYVERVPIDDQGRIVADRGIPPLDPVLSDLDDEKYLDSYAKSARRDFNT